MASVASPLFTVQPRLGLLLLLLVTAWLYAPVGGFDYINWDDGRYVADNPWIEGGLSWRGIVYAFSSTDPFLMPLVRLSYMAESSLLGMDAGHFHLVNVLFHLANTWLLYRVIFLATRRGWLAVLMAAVLALHPQHVEAVAWITERKEVMSGFFGLLSLWWYVGYVQLQQERQGSSQRVDNARAWSVLAFCASLLCKPMWVTLPFVLLLLDFWPLNRLNLGWKKLLWEKQLYFLLSLVFAMLTLVTFSLDGAITNTASVPWEYRLNKMVLSYGEYLWKGIWPFHLSLYYPHPMGNVSSLSFWSVLGALLAISVFCWHKRHTMPHLLMGWLWFLGMLFPVSGVVEGGMPIGLADRWSTIPHIGLSIAIGFSVVQASRKVQNYVTGGFMGVLILWAFLTQQQIATWQNSETVWLQVTKVFPQDGYAYWKLGRFHLLSGHPQQAVHFLQKATQVTPGHADYHASYWQALRANNEIQEANRQLLTLKKILSGKTAPLIRVGEILMRDGHYEQARDFFNQALVTRQNEDHTSYLRFHLALALFASGDAQQGEAMAGQLFSGPEEKVVARCQLARKFFEDDQKPREAFLPMIQTVENHCKGR